VSSRASKSTRLLAHGRTLPPTAFGGLQHGICHVVSGEGVAKRRRQGLASYSGDQKLGELMNERMFVPDLQAGHPPVLHIRMITIGDVNAAPAPQLPFVTMVEPLEAM